MSELVPPQPLDVVAWVTVRYHAHGQISVQGTIADQKFTLELLQHAMDAVRRQIPKKDELLIPNRDVGVTADSALKELGDIPTAERGDA